MRRSHVRFGTTAVVQLFGKGRKERAVPLWTRTSRCLRQWFDEEGEAAPDYAFRNARGDRLTRQGVTHLLDQACRRTRERCPSLNTKRVSPHVVSHTTAMHLLQAGVDMATIALWLGHERLETTHQYVEADLQLKEDALRKLRLHARQRRAGKRLGPAEPDARGAKREPPSEAGPLGKTPTRDEVADSAGNEEERRTHQ